MESINIDQLSTKIGISSETRIQFKKEVAEQHSDCLNSPPALWRELIYEMIAQLSHTL